ncbi:MAG: transcriptional regulator NrdR [Actinobacteria bacterium]|jgi:transcriptional repressor NrdR|nr:transcriptional regulator NrdR [Actinomycetota bacterium]|tara:strand:+ start:105 stop:545 length:441 start_codon:yes stop_codon:yes gene_type:complete
MVCPFCNTEDTAVIDSRKNSEGTSVRRRRKCPKCNSRFTTYEKTEIELIVEKRSGNLEEFQIEKLESGIESAFGGQDITEKQLKTLVENIYKEIKEKGKKVKSKFIGEKVLQHLKEMNEVAYLRYASVYKEFSDVSDFEKEVAEFN